MVRDLSRVTYVPREGDLWTAYRSNFWSRKSNKHEVSRRLVPASTCKLKDVTAAALPESQTARKRFTHELGLFVQAIPVCTRRGGRVDLGSGQLAAAAPVDRSGVIITYVNPGICYTGLNRNAPAFSPVNIQVVIGRILMGRTAEMGSRTLLHGAAAEKECHGTYVSECLPKE